MLDSSKISYLTYLIFCFFIGILSNSIILKCYPFKSKNSTLANIFVKILAYADLLICIFCIPSFIMEIFLINKIFCNIIYLLSTNIILFGLFSSIGVVLERWFATFKPYSLNRKHVYFFNGFNICITLITSMTYFFISIEKNQDGNKNISNCFRTKLQGLDTTNGISLAIVMTCILCEFFAYFHILCHLFKKIKVYKQHKINFFIKIKQLKIVIMLFGTNFILVTTWIPTLLSIYRKLFQNEIIPHLFLLSNCTNFFIYLIFHEKLRSIVYHRFKMVLRNNKIMPRNVTTITTINRRY